MAIVDDTAAENTERLYVTLARRSNTNRLVKRANSDGTLCEDNEAGVNCGAEIRILDDDGANAHPTASNGAVSTRINTAHTFSADDFNFADANAGDTLEKVRIVTLPGAGTLRLSGAAVTANQEVTKSDIDDDDLTFTPETDASGSPYTTFTFKVNDGDAESVAAYTMTVNVTATEDIPPELDSSTVDGDTVVLTYNEPLDEGSVPISDGYIIFKWFDEDPGIPGLDYIGYGAFHCIAGNIDVGGCAMALEDIEVSGASVILTLPDVVAVSRGDGIAFQYSRTLAVNPVRDLAGNRAASIISPRRTVVNITPEPAPEFVSVLADRTRMALIFDEALDSGSTPAPGAFTVLADGSAVTVTAVVVSGREVRLTLASSVAGANAVTVAYEPPAANPLQNADNMAVSAFAAQSVQVVRREVALSAQTLPLLEGDSADYTMTLTVAPSGPVTVTPRVLDNADVTVSGALTFTASNWNQPQTVTVRAGHDADDVDDTATVTHTVSGAEYAGVTAGSVQVAVRDDERVVSYGPLRPEIRSLAAQDGGTNGNTPLWRLALPTEHYGPGDKFHLAVLFWVGTTNRPVQARPGSLAEPAALLGPDKALRVTGANVRFIDVPGDPPNYIRMELTPTGAGDVTVTVEPLPCDAPGAICLQPDRGLSERVRVTVTGVGVAPPAPANVVAAEVRSGYGDAEPDLKVSFDPEPSATSAARRGMSSMICFRVRPTMCGCAGRTRWALGRGRP